MASETTQRKITGRDWTVKVYELPLWEPVLSVEIIGTDPDVVPQPGIPDDPKGKDDDSNQAKGKLDD